MKFLQNTVFAFPKTKFVYEIDMSGVETIDYDLLQFSEKPTLIHKISQEYFNRYQKYARKNSDEASDTFNQVMASKLIGALSNDKKFLEQLEQIDRHKEFTDNDYKYLRESRIELLRMFADVPTLPSEHQHLVRERVMEVLSNIDTGYETA